MMLACMRMLFPVSNSLIECVSFCILVSMVSDLIVSDLKLLRRRRRKNVNSRAKQTKCKPNHNRDGFPLGGLVIVSSSLPSDALHESDWLTNSYCCCLLIAGAIFCDEEMYVDELMERRDSLFLWLSSTGDYSKK